MMNLKIISDGQTVKQMTLKPGIYEIGNHSENDIPLLFPTVSKNHGILEYFNDVLFFTDLGSRNGSFFEERNTLHRIPAHHQFSVQDQILKIGPFSLIFEKTPEKTNFHGKKQIKIELSHRIHGYLAENPLALKEKNEARFFFKRWINNDHEETLDQILEELLEEVFDHGPFTTAFAHTECKEILANSYEKLFVDWGRGLQPLDLFFSSDLAYRFWFNRLVAQAHRRLDLQSPICEGTLPDGSRLHVVLAPISSSTAAVTIRRFSSSPLEEALALETKWMTPQSLEILKAGILQKKNILISGGTSTGKTSLLNFLTRYFDPEERIITIEDTFELKISSMNHVALQARQPNSDGVGVVSLRQLVQSALRMRPDRILVGECRGAEVLEMLQAMNTGHPGSLSTVHANSCLDALHRIETLALTADAHLSEISVRRWMSSAIQYVVQVERNSSGHRFVKEICRTEEFFAKGTIQSVYMCENE